MPASALVHEPIEAMRASRLVLAGLLLAVLWIAEARAPMFPGHRQRVSHGAANLSLAVLNSGLAFLGGFGIAAATEFSHAQQLGLLHRLDLPAGTYWILATLALDCWQYWWHRFNHVAPFLWRFHAVHHSDAELDATSGVRFHGVEIVCSMLARMAVLPALGVTLPVLVVYEALSLPIILFHHSNVRLPERVDRALRWLMVTPWMHWVHHSRWQPETDSNYSSFLSGWDRLFRSFRLRERPDEIRIGLDGWRERDWRTLTGMLATPFRARRRLRP